VLRAWWNSPKGAAIADHLRFRRPDVLTLLSFLFPFLLLYFFLFFFWARLCCGPSIVLCDCYINIAGRKPVSSTLRARLVGVFFFLPRAMRCGAWVAPYNASMLLVIFFGVVW
jgi:hypothetical protein